MRTFMISLFAVMTLASCSKARHTMTVVRDCTGTYLRDNGKDYQVCNDEKLSQYPDGAHLKVSFKRLDNCPEAAGDIVCMMYHENEGWIKVLKIE